MRQTSDCGWVDYLQNAGWPPPPAYDSLGQAVDIDTLALRTGGDASWSSVTDVWYYGNDAARSGTIGDSQETWMETYGHGPGTISF